MVQNTQLENIMKTEVDRICEQILDTMVILNTYAHDPIHFNELFRKVNSFKKKTKMSKPTFCVHIKHLIKKKLIKRKKIGKQSVTLFLNLVNPKIVNLKKMHEQIEKEIKSLNLIVKNQKFWDKFPTIISCYFALCELRRTKIIFQCLLNPEKKTKDNLLAVAWQAKQQEKLEEKITKGLALLIGNKTPTIGEALKKKVIESLDIAILEYQNDFASIAKEFSNA